jgi:hypothetical protein
MRLALWLAAISFGVVNFISWLLIKDWLPLWEANPLLTSTAVLLSFSSAAFFFISSTFRVVTKHFNTFFRMSNPVLFTCELGKSVLPSHQLSAVIDPPARFFFQSIPNSPRRRSMTIRISNSSSSA